jgi:hypothetical protein
MKGAALLATVVSVLACLALPVTAQGASPKASWRCIAGICLWESRDQINYDYGVAADDIPSRTLHVPGGRVWACSWRCNDAVTEDGFTYYGGTQRPANRLLNVSTCDPIFRLPDGVAAGTRIPFRDRWNGYHRRLFEGGAIGWQKTVRSGRTQINVSLQMNKGRVYCVSLEVK